MEEKLPICTKEVIKDIECLLNELSIKININRTKGKPIEHLISKYNSKQKELNLLYENKEIRVRKYIWRSYLIPLLKFNKPKELCVMTNIENANKIIEREILNYKPTGRETANGQFEYMFIGITEE